MYLNMHLVSRKYAFLVILERKTNITVWLNLTVISEPHIYTIYLIIYNMLSETHKWEFTIQHAGNVNYFKFLFE